MFVRSSSPQRPQRQNGRQLHPPSLPEDVGDCLLLDGGVGRSWGRDLRGDQEVEAQPVRPKRTTIFIVVRFSHPFLNPLLTMQNNRPDEEVIPTPRSLNFYFIATLWLWPQPTIPSQPTVSCTNDQVANKQQTTATTNNKEQLRQAQRPRHDYSNRRWQTTIIDEE